MRQWIKNISPDIEATFARFPFAILLSALSTLLAIVLTNDWIVLSDAWALLALGLSIGAVFAVAGALYGESRSKSGLSHIILAFVLPLLCVAALQIESTDLIVAPMLAPISLLWLSLAAFTRGSKGQENLDLQNRFWWLNHRAITTAIIAAIGFGLIAVGIVAIERAMAILFSVHTGKIFYEILLPFTGLFLTPVYWLSTIPRLAEYSEKDISEPDFISRAIGFLGQFILSPFLFAYALILLAYVGEIILNQTLPTGILGWMVLSFTIVGAANWLVLHPGFMHTRLLVKYFRTYWFWLTLAPLALYAIAVWIRIDAYGFTAERVGLVAGGLWSLSLALAFLSRRFADIRLIPGLALGVIVLFSIGPWNFINGPQLHQAARLDTAIHNARPIIQSTGGPYTWSDETGQVARGAVSYLYLSNGGNSVLQDVLTRHGIEIVVNNSNSHLVYAALNIPDVVVEAAPGDWMQLHAIANEAVDLSDTPFFLGRFDLYASDDEINLAHLGIKIINRNLWVKGPNHVEKEYDFSRWIKAQGSAEITNPIFDFVYQGEKYRLVIEFFQMSPNNEQTPATDIWRIEALAFSEKMPPDNLPPVNLTNQ